MVWLSVEQLNRVNKVVDEIALELWKFIETEYSKRKGELTPILREIARDEKMLKGFFYGFMLGLFSPDRAKPYKNTLWLWWVGKQRGARSYLHAGVRICSFLCNKIVEGDVWLRRQFLRLWEEYRSQKSRQS